MKGAFLVSASRSGSTMMSTILREHPDVLSLSELMTTQGSRALLPGAISGETFWQQLATPTTLMRHLANPDSAPREFLYHTVSDGRFDPYRCPPILAVTLPHLFDHPDAAFDRLAQTVPQFPTQPRPDHYRALIETLGAQMQRRYWVERSGGTLLATAALAKAFPQAKFAVILRDARDVTLSMQNYKPARFLVWFWKRARRLGIDVFDPGTQIGSARWIALIERITAPLLPIQRILNTPPAIEDTAACCSALMTSGIRQFQNLPEARRLVVHYENVVAQPHAELARLATFLDLPKNDAWFAFGVGIPRAFPPRHLSLPTDQQDRLSALTADVRKLSAST
ncbi:sulfotransferase [Loktanella sp. Alg231-35]|uniref:sulfotransferase n=1 Tax=Loktanella sp. Alg231-35 TaxID=1922220 RepID=UPI000D556D65|nr:sulfotransferase [Loktanella sp. Alg231-35]